MSNSKTNSSSSLYSKQRFSMLTSHGLEQGASRVQLGSGEITRIVVGGDLEIINEGFLASYSVQHDYTLNNPGTTRLLSEKDVDNLPVNFHVGVCYQYSQLKYQQLFLLKNGHALAAREFKNYVVFDLNNGKPATSSKKYLSALRKLQNKPNSKLLFVTREQNLATGIYNELISICHGFLDLIIMAYPATELIDGLSGVKVVPNGSIEYFVCLTFERTESSMCAKIVYQAVDTSSMQKAA